MTAAGRYELPFRKGVLPPPSKRERNPLGDCAERRAEAGEACGGACKCFGQAFSAQAARVETDTREMFLAEKQEAGIAIRGRLVGGWESFLGNISRTVLHPKRL